ncbi:MAG: DUF1800 domain-containing protein [Phycisphaerales bacterium]
MGNPLQPLARKDYGYAAAQHLLNRAGFGGTPAQVRALVELGLDDAVDYLVEFQGERVSNEGFDFRGDILREQTPEERETLRRARAMNDAETIARIERERQQRQNADRAQVAAMKRWWLARMIETGRPLQEKLTLFWHGHFATGYRTIENSWHMLMQNGMLRSNCAGNFADLVRGIISDPAMLKYLDNDENRKASPNENLARELLELFTLGEGNGYTERDIKEGARALTGRTFRGNEYFFDRAQHDTGGKQIMRRSGDFSGEGFVSIILEQPECARFIALKLYRFFVNDAPVLPPDGAETVERLAKLLRSERYELRPVLRTLFRSQHFHAPTNRQSIIKSPTQLIVQAVRSLGTPARSVDRLVEAGDLMGQELFQPPSVKGWPGGRSWINAATLFTRHNLTVFLITGRTTRGDTPGSADPYDALHLVDHLRGAGGTLDPRECVRSVAAFALGAEPDPARLDELEAYLGSIGGTIDNERLKALLCLITAMPEYQLC